MARTETYIPQHLSPVHFEHTVPERPAGHIRVPGGIGEIAARAAFAAMSQNPDQQRPDNE